MLSFLRLIRFPNLLMVVLTMVLTKYALIESYTNRSSLSHLLFLILICSILCITAGGYIFNDIIDIETDKINKPKKLFIGKFISKKKAWVTYMLISLLGVSLAFFMHFKFKNEIYLGAVFVSFFLLIIYSKYLKKKTLIGNLIISFLVTLPIFIVFSFEALPFIKEAYGSSKPFNLAYTHLVFLIFAFHTTLIREIIKDIEDIDGDYAINAKTLPIVIGRNRANRVAVGFTMLLLLFLIVILKEFVENQPLFLGYGIVFLLLPLLYFLYKLWNAKTKKHYHFLSNLMKLIMLFGILSMLLFKFI